MSRRRITASSAITIALVLLFANSNSGAVAANSAVPKKGATCTKEGIRGRDLKGFEYECLKVGKKLSWSVGHKIEENQNGNGNQGNSQASFALGALGAEVSISSCAVCTFIIQIQCNRYNKPPPTQQNVCSRKKTVVQNIENIIYFYF